MVGTAVDVAQVEPDTKQKHTKTKHKMHSAIHRDGWVFPLPPLTLLYFHVFCILYLFYLFVLFCFVLCFVFVIFSNDAPSWALQTVKPSGTPVQVLSEYALGPH